MTTPKTKKKTLEQVLKKGKPLTYNEIKLLTGLTKKSFNIKLGDLKDGGIPIKAYVDQNTYVTYFYLQKGPMMSNQVYNVDLNDGEYLLGVYGDTHVGDKGYDHNAHLKYYDMLDDRGCELVMHAGDLITGVSIYSNQHVDLNIHTKMEQAEWYVDNCPELSKGETLIIDGNHDTKNMEKSFSPGYFIGDRKSNHRYLGQIAADVRLASNLTARLIHLKGRAYAKSYTLQKYIRGLAPVGMPNMIFKGHSHDSIYMNVQGIECLHTSTLQHGISNFAKELGFQDEIGAWIITYEIENSKLKRFVPELIRF